MFFSHFCHHTTLYPTPKGAILVPRSVLTDADGLQFDKEAKHVTVLYIMS